MIVDVQHHFVPAELAERRGLAPGRGRHDLIEGGLPKFTLHDTLYDLDGQLRDMDTAGIDVAVLTCNLGWDASLDDCRLINDCAAEIQRRYNGRFVALAHAPVLEEAGLHELERAVRGLGLHGVTIASQVAGRSLDGPELAPFYRTACALEAAVFVHPAQLPEGYAFMQDHDLARILGRELDLQVAVTRVIAGGVLDGFPDLRIVFAHFGGGVAAVRERLAAKSGRFGTLTRPFQDSFDGLYFDLAGFEGGPIALRCALDGIRSDRLLFATDYPQDFTGATTQSGKGIAAIRDYIALVHEAAPSPGAARAILGDTAADLFRIDRPARRI